MADGTAIVTSQDGLSFDAETHTYRVNGMVVPSVTQVLRSVGLAIEPYSPNGEQAMERGARVHLACLYDDDGDILESEFTEEELGYLAGWRKFKEETRWVSLSREKPFYSERGYCGTPDAIGSFPNQGVAVLDIKTGTFERWHKLQRAAYTDFRLCFLRVGVYLTSEGNYTIREDPIIERRRDLDIFLAALAIHNWKENTK